MTRAIEHITITTGATRMSPRSEVDDQVLARVRADMMADAPLMGTAWRVAVRETPAGGHVYDLTHAGAEIARCWLCVDRSVSDAMWEAAQSGVIDERVRLARPRGAPWLAAAILPGAITAALARPAVMMEAGDLERVVAWALIERSP